LQGLVEHLSEYLQDDAQVLKTATRDTSARAEVYLSGSMKTERGKRNIERVLEEVAVDGEGDGDQQVHHVLTDSPWDAQALMTTIAVRTSALYTNQPTYQEQDVGYIIDESAHLKKGTQSGGGARQYAGVVGKVDNCQVGVYASLVWQRQTSLINTRLFLPACWTEDDARWEKAGIPEAPRGPQTKPQLAWEMLKADLQAGVRFGGVGGDGLYGHGYEVRSAVEDLGLTVLFDVHHDQPIYLEKPEIAVPEKTPGRGRPPTLPHTDARSTTVKAYQEGLREADWQEVEVRDTDKGSLTLACHIQEVWGWDRKEHQARRWTLVLSRNEAEKKIKYRLSNADVATTPVSIEIGGRQAVACFSPFFPWRFHVIFVLYL
jgi:SRSO17 transposase